MPRITRTLRSARPLTACRTATALVGATLVGLATFAPMVRAQSGPGIPDRSPRLATPPSRTTAARNPVSDVTSARIARARSAEPQNWLTYYGAYDGQRYSQLDQITTRNVRRLGVAWQKDFAQDNPSAKEQAMEAAPIVVDGVMYITTGGQTAVYALDARTGREIWKHETHVSDSLPLCCGWANRGVAVADGRVYFVTLDAKLHALDASTGREAWQTALADPQSGYSATVAP